MNDKINSILAFIILNHSKNSISVFRLIRIMFLAEWYSAIVQKEVLSSAVWYRRNFGPDSDSITKELVGLDIYFEKNNDELDGVSISVFCNDNLSLYNFNLSELEQDIINLAIRHANKFDFIELDNYIENLFPMKNTAINAEIKLKELAKSAP